MTRLRSLLHALTGRRRFEDGMADEMRFHIDAYVDDLIAAGVPRDEALRRARVEFGSIDNAKDDCRQARGLRPFDDLSRDARYAVRLMRRTPAFTVTALATLALCLGANLTIFAVVDAVVLRPLPFPASDRLVSVFNTYPNANVPNDGCSLTNYYERRGQLSAFAGVAAYRDATAIVGDPGATEQIDVTHVSPDFFATLGVGPIAGRTFTEAETAYKQSAVAILTDTFWRQRLDADPRAVGRTIRIDGFEATVVGILPPAFSFLSSKARVYLPLASNPDERGPARRHSGTADMIGRLAPDASLDAAQAQIDAHSTAVGAGAPDEQFMADAGFRSLVVPLHASHIAAIRPTLLFVQAGALCLLLIGAVNLVNLLLVRASGRGKERAIRQAIGAGRRHIAAAMLTETLVLSLAGGLLGLGVGAIGIRLLALLGTDRLPLGALVTLDARVLSIALVGTVLVGLALALPVVWYSLRDHAANALHAEYRGTTSGRAAQRLRHAFIVAQIALAFVLLAGAGLLGLSFQKATAISPGFRAASVLSGELTLPGMAYKTGPALAAATDRLVEAIGRQPGVAAAGAATNVPFSGISNKSSATVKGYVPQPGESPRGIYSYSVAGRYFEVMGFTLLEGRVLTPEDSHRAERTCVVDEDFARHYWPRGGAVGQQLFEGSGEGPIASAYTIVGVVRPVKQAELTDIEAPGAVYYPFGHRPDRRVFLVTRSTLPATALAPTLRDAVRQVDPELPLTDVQSMDARIADSLVARRSPALLAALFSAIALLLTAVGTYGVLSYAVAHRRREIGLRMALGAQPEQVRAQFIAVALRLLAGGAALGLVGAWLAGRAMQTVLFNVPAVDARTLIATGMVIGVVSLIACLLPSHRAARISPMEALSDE